MERFASLSTVIVSAGTEKADVFRSYWETHQIPFTGLPDPEQKVLKLYGQEVKPLKLGRLPAQMLIDRQGILRMVHYGQSMSDIPANETVLKQLESIS